MELVGELERFFSNVIYPNRALFGAATLVVLAALAFGAVRRGWHRIPRRHPRATIAIAVPLLAVGIPVAWYLGSPLFITTRADEGTDAADGGAVVARGEFAGADEFHFGRGIATIEQRPGGGYTLRFTEFAVRNGPDLYVYLSPDSSGYVAGATELGTLKASEGAFGYDLPAGLDPAAFRSVVIWCRAFSVEFAVARLSTG